MDDGVLVVRLGRGPSVQLHRQDPRVLLHPPGFDEMRAPVGGIQAVGAYPAAGRRGVDETSLPNIDANVGGLLTFLIEEHQIASAQLARAHQMSLAALRLRLARKVDAGLGITVLDQPAAIEAGGRVAAVTVGLAQHREGTVGRAVGDRVGNRGGLWRRRLGRALHDGRGAGPLQKQRCECDPMLRC